MPEEKGNNGRKQNQKMKPFLTYHILTLNLYFIDPKGKRSKFYSPGEREIKFCVG